MECFDGGVNRMVCEMGLCGVVDWVGKGDGVGEDVKFGRVGLG